MLDGKVYEGLRLFYHKNYSRWLPTDRQAHILDVGCGAGHFLYFLQNEGYDQAEGLDISEEMIEQCHVRNLKHIHLSGWRDFLTHRATAYDTIVANDFLEHLSKEEIFEFLDLILIALQPRCRLILKLPNAYTIFGTRDRYIDFTHELSFTPQSILQVFTTIGFDPVWTLPVYAPIRGFKSILKRAIWGLVFMPVVRACSFIFDGERQPAIYTVNILAIGEKPGN